uniref:Uncharacterized protein n=1 Tax=Quercus lobata TaxID=97700 RepID=A0A7N2MLS2_QUELO
MTERSRSFSLEGENELARSTKKVKDSHNGGPAERIINPGGTSFSSKLSFRDKLVGDIPGAYSQAFAFLDHMDAESKSDEEIKDIKEGMAAISLSR